MIILQSTGIAEAHCKTNLDCPEGDSLTVGNGVFTGKCVNANGTRNKTCEVRAWCPVENDHIPM